MKSGKCNGREMEDFIRKHYRRLTKYLSLRAADDWHSLEDIAQQAFFNLIEACLKGTVIQNPLFYVYRIARNELSRHWKNKAKKRAIETPLEDTPVEDFDETGLESLENLMASVNGVDVQLENEESWIVWQRFSDKHPETAQILALYYLEQFSFAEIAMILDCTPDHVRKYHMHEARKKVKQFFGAQLNPKGGRHAKK